MARKKKPEVLNAVVEVPTEPVPTEPVPTEPVVETPKQKPSLGRAFIICQ